MEHELWLTRAFNEYLAGPANGVLSLIGAQSARPWENSLVVELLVVALIMIVVAIMRAGLSADKPGTLQNLFETIYNFIEDTVEQVGVEHGERYAPFIGTIFLFILCMNLIGIVPAFESPTMSPWVPAGLAVVTFFYFNIMGFMVNGPGYLKQFAGPVRFGHWLADLAIIAFMIPIETVSVFIRPLSLTVRLYGNMYAGEQVTGVFLSLTKIVLPVIFMALHVFVAFVQAYVFTLLATIYVAQAVSHEH
jgi:F-type H+-transporting ATPase subunit a